MSEPHDPDDLERFVRAQSGGVHETAVAELRRGRKASHWMWFVFPQLVGLGRSPTAQRYGISGVPEAIAYLAHPVLGPRLVEASTAARDAPAPSADALLGSIDVLKLRSSMTLFSIAQARSGGTADPAADGLFDAVLDRWYDGEHDPATERMCAS